MKTAFLLLLLLPCIANAQCSHNWSGAHLSLSQVGVDLWAYKKVGTPGITADHGPHPFVNYDPDWPLDPCEKYVLAAFSGFAVDIDSLLCMDTIQSPCCFDSEITPPGSNGFTSVGYTLDTAQCAQFDVSWSKLGAFSYPMHPPYSYAVDIDPLLQKFEFPSTLDSVYMCFHCHCKVAGTPFVSERCEWIKP